MADDTKNDPKPLTDAEVAQLRREALTPPGGTRISDVVADLTDKTKVSWPVMLALLAVAAFATQTQFTAGAAEKTADSAIVKIQQKADVTDLKAVVTDVTLLKIVTAKQSTDLVLAKYPWSPVEIAVDKCKRQCGHEAPTRSSDENAAECTTGTDGWPCFEQCLYTGEARCRCACRCGARLMCIAGAAP